MNANPEGWGRRALSGLALVLVIALGARWAYELLAPLVPFAASLLVVGAVGVLLFKRRR
ncbi:hypothetical protein GCM10018980_40120 [Streptomyces capoamus]|uniref:Uncharacterized protein n=1 Tax=Streptomyces capoamus TaxID=68183 RepID=A0A919C6R2_9ACTN|nr:hypothetical protein [Streptomyces capoamus]GGW15160.1 hypothetical protein GCM10010501_26060 [Streptomyces libani subsp. rufus]GHG55002.1 hypothetical protein GCM10018980_40120 [Streptomyces capoamus]